MKRLLTKAYVSFLALLSVLATTTPVFAAETAAMTDLAAKAKYAAITIAAGAVAGALAMGLSIFKSVDGIAKQPESAGKIQTVMMLGLVFIETAIIYALIVAILIVFVL